MTSRLALQERNKTTTPPVPARSHHVAVRPTTEHMARVEQATETTGDSHFMQDFSQVAVHAESNAERYGPTPSCLVTPTRCPFGGACHECPARVQTKRIGNQTENDHVHGENRVPPIVHEVLGSPGQPLDAETRGFMEPRFGYDFSRIRARTDTQAVKAPSAPINKFEDCPVDWQGKANTALVVARKWVANVVTGLANLPYPFPAPVANLLNRHFRITGRGYVYEVRRHFNTIYSALNSPIDFECEKKCDDNVAAYVYSMWSDVHLCPIWYKNLDANGKANTIIHELAHDAANRDDEAYIWEPGYSKLSVEDAIDNADSYSNFAQEAYGA